VALPNRPTHEARILVVDDEEPNIRLLEQILGADGFTCIQSTSDSRQVLDLYREFEPDLILLDIKMPHLDGHQVLEQLGDVVPDDEYLPVLVLTSDGSTPTKRRALSSGAKDFLTKPFSSAEVRLRVHNLLETRLLHRALRDHNRLLEQRVERRTAQLMHRTEELEEARVEILERLARAAEFRDDATGFHTRRVARVASLLAQRLGLPDDEVGLIWRAAPLHDIGKIGVPDSVLLKPGPLDSSEIDLMRAHAAIGADILSGSRVSLLGVGREIALTHHEWWDGTGYPAGLRDEAIPVTGRLVAAADVFDALTHKRPYKNAWSIKDAADEIRRLAGTQFDPAVVTAFGDLFREGLLDERRLEAEELTGVEP
jgi:putative two-component system response regulator